MSKTDEVVEVRERRRPGRSLLGPIVLIAIGLYFLLDNVNVLPPLDWGAALSLWPLLLIFLGLNLIVRQAPRPLGTLLSGVVALLAIAVFSFFLLGGQVGPFGGGQATAEVQRETVRFSESGVEDARVDVDFSQFSSRVAPLEARGQLLEADVAYVGELIFLTDVTDGRAEIILDTEADFSPYWWFNPSNWIDDDNEWEILLSPDVPLELQFNVGSGSVDFELETLMLRSLEFDGGSGSAEMQLPDGDYDARCEVGSGSLRLWLPEDGEQMIDIEGGSGSVTLYLAGSTEARIVVEDGGSGSFQPGARLDQVEEGDGDEGVWETPGYEEGADGVSITLDIGSGSVRVLEDS